MEFVPLVVMLAMVAKLLDLGKMLVDRNYRAAALQVAAFAVGIAVVFLFGATDYAAELAFGGVSLAAAAAATKVVVGVAVASTASLAHDSIMAVRGRQPEVQKVRITHGSV